MLDSYKITFSKQKITTRKDILLSILLTLKLKIATSRAQNSNSRGVRPVSGHEPEQFLTDFPAMAVCIGSSFLLSRARAQPPAHGGGVCTMINKTWVCDAQGKGRDNHWNEKLR
jgi:hypothetical protein